MSDELQAVGFSKHWLLLPVKLRMTEVNAWKNMALGSTFRFQHFQKYGTGFNISLHVQLLFLF